jgi:HEAT repeat protein
MGLKETVMRLLEMADSAGLKRLVAQDPRAVRHLVGRLWDPEPEIRYNAARAIGVVAALRPESGRELARRFMWALNDESATNGAYVVSALGEIGYHDPDLLAPFVAPLASHLRDDGLRPEILLALSRIAERQPGLVKRVRGELEQYRNVGDTTQRKLVEQLLECKGSENGT